ncbi:hypothetical protein H2248_005300 [Termitomyces sp. 'cryptogamus']|nr:hypothetical protein H2248_005300 [Termitomyces sp. 'cryptogamus']
MFTSKAGRLIPFDALQNTKRLFINTKIAWRSTARLPRTRLRVTTFHRSFTTPSNSCMAQPSEPEEAALENEERWISILENTTSAPWLFSSKPGPKEKMMLAYILLFQIILYISRPKGGEQFLIASAFGTAPAPTESEIGRARIAVPVILRAVVHNMSTVPLDSPLRREHSDIFGIFGALQAIHDMYLTDTISDLQTWTTFWSRVQPVVIELVTTLDEKGFGLSKDEVEKELKESK